MQRRSGRGSAEPKMELDTFTPILLASNRTTITCSEFGRWLTLRCRRKPVGRLNCLGRICCSWKLIAKKTRQGTHHSLSFLNTYALSLAAGGILALTEEISLKLAPSYIVHVRKGGFQSAITSTNPGE